MKDYSILLQKINTHLSCMEGRPVEGGSFRHSDPALAGKLYKGLGRISVGRPITGGYYAASPSQN